MRDFRDAKIMAQALRNALQSRAVETTHSESLELIAKAFGYDNWNILAAKIEAAQPRPGAAPALSPAGISESASQKTLYCSFCSKSQHHVRKLIAGPLVYICDECVQICTDIVQVEDTFWKFLELLRAENGGAHAAALDHLQGRPTEDLASYVRRSKEFAEHNRVIVQCIRRRLAMRSDEEPGQDDVLSSPEFAYLKNKSKEELLALQQGAQHAVKRCEDAVRLATRVLGERGQESSA